MVEPFLYFLGPFLISILAIYLGIWYEKKQEVERMRRKLKYLTFSMIGIFSFFGGFYLGDEMQLGYLIFKATGGPSTIFPFALIIYALLFFLGLYISKEHSLGFGLKAFGISFLFFFLAFYGIMAYGAHEHYYAKAISIEKFGVPKEYVNIAEEELERYPFLKEAIELAYTNESSKIHLHPEKWLQLEAFLGIKDGKTIKIGEEYYKVHFLSGLAFQKLGETPNDYVTITGEDLENYPALKRALEYTDEGINNVIEGLIIVGLNPDEWLQVENYLNKKPSGTIKTEAGYYEIELISDLMVQKYEILPTECTNITKEELDEYPALKKAIEDARKSEDSRATLKVHPDEWGRIQAFITEKGSYNIRVGDEYYAVAFICA
jgi:hypothetical protein